MPVTVIILALVVTGLILIRDKAVSTDVTARTTRVGLIITGKKDDANFCQLHYDSLMDVSDELNLDIICKEGIPEDETCETAVRELVEDYGCRIIVGASFGYTEYMTNMAKKYPDLYFIQPFGTEKLTNLTSCMGRMYQARYLSGIVAGMRTKSGKLGYVAAFPFPEVIRDLNAFTLGVRSVAPEAEVYVRYIGSWNDDEAAGKTTGELLELQPDIDVVSMHTNSLKPNEVAEEKGVWSVGYNKDNAGLFPKGYLTACEWQWDVYYRRVILSCLQGKFHGAVEWLDMESGVLGLSELTANCAPGTAEAVERAGKRFFNRSFDVFYGPVRDNEGVLRVPEDESMSDDDMLDHFDWYVEGVTVEN